MYDSYWRAGVLAVALTTALGIGACHPAPPVTPPFAHPISRAQVLADLTRFQQIKEAADAGLYKYHSKAKMDSAFAAARARVTDHMTVLEAYRLVMELTDFEGSLHNDTFLPDSVQHALYEEPAFFPYPLKEVAGQVVLNTAHAPLPLGSRVVSLNGIPARRLVRELGKYYTTDGVNTTGKTVGFAASFPKYYRLQYGPQTAFHLRYLPPGTTDTLEQTLPAVPYATYRLAFAARHSYPSDRSFFEGMPAQYTFQLRPAQALAILTVNTFNIGDIHPEEHRRYARFLDSCFTLLRHYPAINRLLVDVRGNGGGNDDNDMMDLFLPGPRPLSGEPSLQHQLCTRAV